MLSAQIKGAEMNSSRSCEMSFIGLEQLQPADSVDTEGKSDLCRGLPWVRQKWPSDGCVTSCDGG